MNYLKDKMLYLSGPIQYSDNINWRSEPTKKFTELGINVFDPFEDPKQKKSDLITKAQKEKDYKFMQAIAKSFVRKDLGMVDRADFIVAYLPYKVPTIGTCHEIINSNNLKKPTLLVTNTDDIGFIPLWYFGFIPLEFMFPNWEKLYEYLNEVNNGLHNNDDRWKLVCGEI